MAPAARTASNRSRSALSAGETTAAREQHYKRLLTQAPPEEYRDGPSHQAKWPWRTLRAADL